ncbi:conserved hypothetical protein [Xenorhabdus nematophila str. Websteri]|nr:conserved hypothetical protein [Xenorhabdus nematophila str. Websteri]CEF32728.1 conserved hypothetical protein [Xenorhabdus nematophila str. Websteri]
MSANEPQSRFIPVLTGNTFTNKVSFPPIAVYPRTYGEHHRVREIAQPDYGLSLYLRGTPDLIPAQQKPTRFIPVLTGNTRQ